MLFAAVTLGLNSEIVVNLLENSPNDSINTTLVAHMVTMILATVVTYLVKLCNLNPVVSGRLDHLGVSVVTIVMTGMSKHALFGTGRLIGYNTLVPIVLDNLIGSILVIGINLFCIIVAGKITVVNGCAAKSRHSLVLFTVVYILSPDLKDVAILINLDNTGLKQICNLAAFKLFNADSLTAVVIISTLKRG